MGKESETFDSSLGISRRSLLRRGAAVGAVVAWTAPVVESLRPALAVGTLANDISFVAVLVKCNGAWYRMKWDTTILGGLDLDTGSKFPLGDCPDSLQPAAGTVATGAAPGTTATLNADGSISVDLGPDCTLHDFVVKRGQCCAGPGEAGEPLAGQTGSTVTFVGPMSNLAGCA